MLVSLNRTIVSDLKRELSRVFPAARSAHLSEALARGLGFETNSVLSARVPVEGRSAFGDHAWLRGRAAVVDDAALLGFLASTGFRAAAATPLPSSVYAGGPITSATERPLLQSVLRCRERAIDPEPETAAEQCLLRLAEGARRAEAAVRRGEMRPTGVIRLRPDHYHVDMTLLPPAPGEPTEDDLVAGFMTADIEALTQLSARVGWADDHYPCLRQGFMDGSAPPLRFSHLGPETGTSVLVWDAVAAVLDVRKKTYPNRETVRLSPELRNAIERVAVEVSGNEARVKAIRELVRQAPPWEVRDPNRREDDHISWPYRKRMDDEGITCTSQRGSFGLTRFDLVIVPIPRKGFTARVQGATKDLAKGRGPTSCAAMLGLLRERCRAASDAVLADAKSGSLCHPTQSHIESIEALAEACNGDLGRYTHQTSVSLPGLEVNISELGALVEHDLDTWLRSGGVPRHATVVPAKTVTPDFEGTTFVSAVDGAGVGGVGALLAEDAASRARAGIRDGRPGFANVAEDIRAACGDIDSLLKALRRHRRVLAALRGFSFHNGQASIHLTMTNSGFGEALVVEVPHDEALAMVEGLARASEDDPSDGKPLNFRWRVPGPHAPDDIIAIRAMETRTETYRYVATSVMWAI